MKTNGKVVCENVLDFALDAFSAPNEDEIYQVVQNASIEQIDSVLDRYRTWAALGIVRAPSLEAGELRPYFVTSSGLAAWARGGLDNRDGFKNQTAIWAAVDSIKHRLLYCHSVAIDDAFGWLLYRNSMEKTADARDHLLNYISFLLHMAPLLRRSILCPVTSDLYLPEIEGKANARWTRVRDRVATELKGDDFWGTLSLDEFITVAPEDVKRSWERELRKPVAETVVRKGVFLSSCERVGRALSASANAQDRLTTYFPFRYDVDVLTAYQRSVSSRERSALSRLNLHDYDNWLLSRLIDVELPNLGELQPEDVVQIRTNSSEFADWRKTLASAVSYADNAVPADIWGRNEAVRREISERLQEGKARLEASLPTTVLKVVKTGTVKMVSGAIATGLSVLVDPTMTTAAILAALTATAALSIIETVPEATKGTTSTAKQAARAHYLAVLR